MEGTVEALLAGRNSTFPVDDREEEDAMAMASSSASPAFVFAFLAPPLSLLRHVACLCAGYLGLDGGLKPSAPAPAAASSSSSSAAADAACQRDEVEAAASAFEDCTEVVLEVRSRGTKPKPSFTRPTPRSTTPRQSTKGAVGGDHN